MSDKHIEEAMVSVMKKLGLDPETTYRVERFNANLWLSSIYRVIVEPTDPSRAAVFLIVKRFHEDAERREFFESHVSFRNEFSVYTRVLDAFTEFQREKGLSEPFQFSPRCYHAHCDGENDILILDDLVPQGYATPSCQQAMGLKELRLVVQTLGRFHALSLVMKSQQPERFRELSSTMAESVWIEKLIKHPDNLFAIAGMSIFKMLVKQVGSDCDYALKLRPFATRIIPCMQATIRTDLHNEPWNVITHGDLWASNMMLSMSSSPRMRFIDFQQTRYGSPALDLSTVLYLCMDGPMRDGHRDELLQLYHQSLSDFLVQVGSDPELLFPYHKVEEQLQKYGRYGLGVSFLNVPHAMHESLDQDPQVEGNIPMKEVVGKEIYHMSAVCRLRMLDNIRDAVDRGYLD